MSERVIRLDFCDPCIITAAEYEAIQRDLLARHFVGDSQPGDKVLAQLLSEMAPRYHEIKNDPR